MYLTPFLPPRRLPRDGRSQDPVVRKREAGVSAGQITRRNGVSEPDPVFAVEAKTQRFAGIRPAHRPARSSTTTG